MVYSCIGAEIEDSDGSSNCDIKATDLDTDRSTTISDAPADTRTNGHVVSSKQQTDRQMEAGRQERILPLADSRTEMEGDRPGGGGNVAPCGLRPEPPPQSTKPSLAVMRQRHLQESLEEAGGLEEEEQSERKREEKQRVRGPEGQRPLIPNKPSLDLTRDKTSPDNGLTPPTASPVSPREDPTNDKRSFPAAQPISPEEATAEGKSPPAPAKPGPEAADPAISQDEEEGRNGFPATSHHTRKSNSFDIGMERDSPYDLERSSDRRFPVKKPCFPQCRNRSLDYPAGTRCYDSPQLGNRDAL